MDNINLGHKTIRLIYKDFKHYFQSGDVILGGSYYYKKVGCPVKTDYKDVDLIIDENKDYIFHEILDYYESNYIVESSRNDYKGILSGFFHINDYVIVDLFTNDFTNLLPPFEIIPGVLTYRTTDTEMVKLYKELEELSRNDNQKYKEVKEFFQNIIIQDI